MGGTVRFGTDGWRALIAGDYTYANVRRAAHGVAVWLRRRRIPRGRAVVVGYDTRFLSSRFAAEAAAVLHQDGFRVLLSPEVVTTPCVSYTVQSLGAACGVVITSSHNPARYNGFKVKLPQGCSAFEEDTRVIGSAANAGPGIPAPRTALAPSALSFLPAYLQALKRRADWQSLSKAKIRVVVDAMHGAAGSLLPDRFPSRGMRLLPFRAEPDPLFGGVAPEPVGANLDALKREVLRTGAGLGLAFDGDGDRLGLVDEKGQEVNAHRVFGILLRHLAGRRKGKGAVVRTVSGTALVDRICEAHGLECRETPIGFKYAARLMLDKGVLMAGEESGGFGIGDHLPERDGLLAGLLVLEALAASGMSLSRLVQDMGRSFGSFSYLRWDLEVRADAAPALRARLKAWQPSELAGLKVRGRSDLDGAKFFLEDGAWLLLRTSGTEPVVRLYSEATSLRLVESLLKAGRRALAPFLGTA